MGKLQIKIVTYTEALEEIRLIRTLVFHKEQGVDLELEFDGKDSAAEHLLAYLDNQAVGTARIRQLSEDIVKIERVAVVKSARGKGIGKKLTQTALDLAMQQGFEAATIHAQEYVKGLYSQLGFVQVGDKFDEAGIPHVKMVRKLR